MKKVSTKKLVYMALFAAATAVATIALRIPFAHGYFNLGEIMIYTAALTLGPMVGGIAGGLGAALADMYTGYLLPWAPITLVVKGLEGLIVGKLGYNRSSGGQTVAVIIGGLVVIIGYPLASALLYGWPAFLPELYMDIVQVTVGAAIAIPLSKSLKKIFDEEHAEDF